MFAIAAFATPTDLATYLQRDFTAADTATASLVLDIATAEIQDFTSQTISLVTETITIDPPRGNELFLPQMPVVSVASVTVAGIVLSSVTPDYYVYPETGIVVMSASLWGNSWGNALGVSYGQWGYVSRWGYTPRSVVVTYTHGYAVIPDAVKGVCLDLAAALIDGVPLGQLKSEAIGTYSYERNGLPMSAEDIIGDRLAKYRVMVLA